jgi:hypothetical protein
MSPHTLFSLSKKKTKNSYISSSFSTQIKENPLTPESPITGLMIPVTGFLIQIPAF